MVSNFECFVYGAHDALVAASPGESLKALRLKCVQADVQSSQSSIAQRRELLLKHQSIRRHAHCLDAFDRGQRMDDFYDVFPNRRLSPSQSNLVDSTLDKELCLQDQILTPPSPSKAHYQSKNLVRSQQLRSRRQVDAVLRHAVFAPQIAPLSEGDAKICVTSPEELPPSTSLWRLA